LTGTPAASETRPVQHPPATTRLPPLNALRTFEAAGRLQSIRRAAAELVVTPGAVSRQVRMLESWLGTALFDHDARPIRLTDAGIRYLAIVSEHLSAIATATDELTGQWAESALHLRSYTFFATNWLVPRLTRFHRSQPWVELQLTTSSRSEDFGSHDVDAEIRPGTVLPWARRGSKVARFSGFVADLLVSERVVLVCSPAYRIEHRLEEPQDLVRLGAEELLRSIASPDLWRLWLDAAGVTGLDPGRGPSYGDSVLTCRAAAAGQGVGLAPLAFVEPGRTVCRQTRAPDGFLPRLSR
jgi:LysR family transcriptional regulator, glycine cleavage system transcriptional activator